MSHLTDDDVIRERQNVLLKYDKYHPFEYTKLDYNDIKSNHQIQSTPKAEIHLDKSRKITNDDLIEILRRFKFNLIDSNKTNDQRSEGILICSLFGNEKIKVSINEINSNSVTKYKISQINTTQKLKISQQNIFISSLQLIIDLSNANNELDLS